jgi:hypothetical protein
LISLVACDAGKSSDSSSGDDTTAPTPGNSGTITTSSVSGTTLTLNWTAARDEVTAESELQYAVYQSSASNISAVSDCEDNGTLLQDYTANLTTQTVSGLSLSTTYYFNVIVKDRAGNKAAYTIKEQTTTATSDSTAPTPGNSGTITTSSVSGTSLTLNWTAASDDTTSQPDLQYLAYYSTSNNIDTVSNCESNGTAVGSYTANITSKSVSGLSTGTTYYFNVVVKDTAGNKGVYTTKEQATSSTADTTAPTPGNSGTITTSSVATTSLTLNWTAATDDTTSQSDLQYLAYYSTSNNIGSVLNCENNGTAVGSYTANITTKNVTSGLSAGTTYYFNVIVKDTAGNKAVYTTKQQATASAIPSDYIFRWKLENNGNDEKGTLHLSNSTGSPVYSSSSPKEGSYYFIVDGDDDIYSASYNVTSSSISMAGWFYVDSTFSGTNPTAVDMNGMGIWYNSSVGKIRGGPSSGVYAQGTISTNTWYHVAFTWDNSNAKMYVNGSLTETYPGSSDITTINAALYFGSKSGSSYWDGYMDDIIVYDRALSASEVSDIYSSY